MSRCTNCRKVEGLDTRWERCRYWIVSHLFPNDLKDERSNAFTQGFSDGYAIGARHIGEEKDKYIAELVVQSTLPIEFPLPNMELVLTTAKTGQLLLNGHPIEPKKRDDLRHEAQLLRNTTLWKILTETLKHQAQEVGWNLSKDTQDLMNAKSFTRAIGVQEEIIKKLEKK